MCSSLGFSFKLPSVGSVLLLLVSLLSMSSAFANNGAVTMAGTVDGDTIRLNGDFSDWPAESLWVPIEHLGYGDHLASPKDCKAAFRVLCDRRKGHLFVAIRVEDDHLVKKTGSADDWHAYDNVTLYLGRDHGERGSIGSAFAIDGSASDIKGSIASVFSATKGNLHQVEWRIDLKTDGNLEAMESGAPFTCSLDFMIGDCDPGGDYTALVWGPGISKVAGSTRFGDLIIPSSEAAFGTLTGLSNPEAIGPTMIRLQSLDHPSLRVDCITDKRGQYSLTLPSGRYHRELRSGPRIPHETIIIARGEERTDVVPGLAAGPATEIYALGPAITRPLAKGTREDRGRIYTGADGLPDDNFNAMTQDRSGALWLGGHGTLIRMDGRIATDTYEFANGQDESRVLSIHYKQHTDQFWVGSGKGLYLVAPNEGTVARYLQLDGKEVRAMAEGDHGQMLFCTKQGLYLKRGETFEPFTESDGLPSNIIYAAVWDPRSKHFWIASEGGLSRFDGERFENYGQAQGMPDPRVLDVCLDSEGTLWASTGRTLVRFNGKGFEVIDRDESSAFGFTEAMRASEDGIIVLDGEGVYRYAEEQGSWRKEIVTKQSGRSFFIDRDGTLWVSSQRGLFQKLLQLVGLGQNGTVSVAGRADGQGRIWFASAHVVRQFERLGAKEPEWNVRLDSEIHVLARVSDNEVLVGTTQGVIRLRDGVIEELREAPWPQAAVRDIQLSSDGSIWLMAEGAVHHLKGSEYRKFTPADGLPDRAIKLALHPDGETVAVTTIHGVALIRGGFVEAVRNLGKLTWDSTFDSQGTLWIASAYGLKAYRDGTLTSYGKQHGLSSEKTSFLAVGPSDEIWVKGNDTVVNRFDGKVFQTLNGQDSEVFNQTKAFHRHGDVMLCLTKQATYCYHFTSSKPSLSLQNAITDRILGPVNAITTNTSAKDLQLTITGTSLKTRAGGLLYRHRLLGHTSEWTISRSPKIHYSDLPIDEYEFQAQVIDRDLQYSEVLSVPIKVTPPYGKWLTYGLAALLGCVVISVGALFLVRNHQTKRVLEKRVAERTQALEEEITERELTEDKLRQSQKLEAVGTLAGGIAHDFNNLLTAITGNLAVAQLDSGSHNEHISAAESAARRAAELVKQLLGFSRNTSMDFRICDVNAIITELRRLLRHAFDANVELEYDLADRLPPIKADSVQIEQVLLNLCCNARDSMNGGKGRVTIKTSLVPSSGARHQVQISVRDNGSGMTNEVREKIFEPFFTTKDQGKGTGLGLAMCYGIIEQHHGQIACKSSLGKGSTFMVTFPAESRNVPLSDTLAEEQSLEDLKGTERVLVVDDESVVRAVASGLLSRNGYNIITADSGKAALETLERSESEIDAVLLDVTMPGMSGKEVLVEVKRRYPELPVVICTGYLLSPDELEAELGVRPAACVQKPYELNILLKTLRSIFATQVGTSSVAA